MPWINKQMCTICRICITSCPENAITIQNNAAFINDNKCIRCGICHDICPQNAVRHDSEKIPEEVEKNFIWVKGLLENKFYNSLNKKQEVLERLKRHFLKNKKVAEKTLEKIDHIIIK